MHDPLDNTSRNPLLSLRDFCKRNETFWWFRRLFPTKLKDALYQIETTSGENKPKPVTAFKVFFEYRAWLRVLDFFYFFADPNYPDLMKKIDESPVTTTLEPYYEALKIPNVNQVTRDNVDLEVPPQITHEQVDVSSILTDENYDVIETFAYSPLNTDVKTLLTMVINPIINKRLAIFEFLQTYHHANRITISDITLLNPEFITQLYELLVTTQKQLEGAQQWRAEKGEPAGGAARPLDIIEEIIKTKNMNLLTIIAFLVKNQLLTLPVNRVMEKNLLKLQDTQKWGDSIKSGTVNIAALVDAIIPPEIKQPLLKRKQSGKRTSRTPSTGSQISRDSEHIVTDNLMKNSNNISRTTVSTQLPVKQSDEAIQQVIEKTALVNSKKMRSYIDQVRVLNPVSQSDLCEIMTDFPHLITPQSFSALMQGSLKLPQRLGILKKLGLRSQWSMSESSFMIIAGTPFIDAIAEFFDKLFKPESLIESVKRRGSAVFTGSPSQSNISGDPDASVISKVAIFELVIQYEPSERELETYTVLLKKLPMTKKNIQFIHEFQQEFRGDSSILEEQLGNIELFLIFFNDPKTRDFFQLYYKQILNHNHLDKLYHLVKNLKQQGLDPLQFNFQKITDMLTMDSKTLDAFIAKSNELRVDTNEFVSLMDYFKNVKGITSDQLKSLDYLMSTKKADTIEHVKGILEKVVPENLWLDVFLDPPLFEELSRVKQKDKDAFVRCMTFFKQCDRSHTDASAIDRRSINALNMGMEFNGNWKIVDKALTLLDKSGIPQERWLGILRAPDSFLILSKLDAENSEDFANWVKFSKETEQDPFVALNVVLKLTKNWQTIDQVLIILEKSGVPNDRWLEIMERSHLLTKNQDELTSILENVSTFQSDNFRAINDFLINDSIVDYFIKNIDVFLNSKGNNSILFNYQTIEQLKQFDSISDAVMNRIITSDQYLGQWDNVTKCLCLLVLTNPSEREVEQNLEQLMKHPTLIDHLLEFVGKNQKKYPNLLNELLVHGDLEHAVRLVNQDLLDLISKCKKMYPDIAPDLLNQLLIHKNSEPAVRIFARLVTLLDDAKDEEIVEIKKAISTLFTLNESQQKDVYLCLKVLECDCNSALLTSTYLASAIDFAKKHCIFSDLKEEGCDQMFSGKKALDAGDLSDILTNDRTVPNSLEVIFAKYRSTTQTLNAASLKVTQTATAAAKQLFGKVSTYRNSMFMGNTLNKANEDVLNASKSKDNGAAADESKERPNDKGLRS